MAEEKKIRPGDGSSPDRTIPRAELIDDGTVPTTLYEKKCLLINAEIETMGMGRYQWYLWALCGLGYMIDLLWAQAFGLVLSPLKQELGFGDAQTGNLSTAFSSGLTAGAFVWGILVDVIGRQWAFNLTVFISSIFGLCLGIPDSYTTILVLTAFVGFGVGGNIPIDTTITLEFIPTNKRWLLPFLSVFQPIGVVICSAIAYGFIPSMSCSPNFSEQNPLKSCNDPTRGAVCCTKKSNMGWRYFLFTIGGITLFVFFLRFVVFRFQESPKFLIYRGRDADAIKVMQNVAKFNKKPCNVTLEQLQAIEDDEASLNSSTPVLGGGAKQLHTTWKQKLRLEAERFKILFSNATMARLTILVWLTYICDFWGFTVAGTYLPTILAKKNAALNLDLRFTYRSYVYIYLPGIVGVIMGVLLYRIPAVGQKWSMVVSSALMAIAIFVLNAVNTQASNIGLSAMEYIFQSMFNAILYGWTPTVFPAPIRGTACGLASFWGRLFGIVSPLIAAHLYASNGGGNAYAVLNLAGGVTLGCVVTTALLPNKFLGKQSL